METSPADNQPEKPLDPLVKTALTICIGLIVMTVAGMILTAPDRSIPPYSVIAQQGEHVTVHVPTRTTDPEIEALLVRFQVVGQGNRGDFAHRKISSTTAADPAGPYQRVTLYIFDDLGLADASSLNEYIKGSDPLTRSSFERGIRGVYRLTAETEFAAMGNRILFQGKVSGGG